MTTVSGNKLTREEFFRQKNLEVARKAGTIPAEVDEEGHEINPHIPQYIAKAPWYMDTGAPSLKHQKLYKEESEEQHSMTSLPRGIKVQTSTKYRPGACANCGAVTHKTHDCMERPRKVGAKYTGLDIAPDEMAASMDVSSSGSPLSTPIDYDGKRDRWNGFDPEEYEKVVQNYEVFEMQRKKVKEQEIERKLLLGSQSNPEDTLPSLDAQPQPTALVDEEDEERYAEQSDLPGQKVDLKSRMTVRNLRIREDTAKYLRNLDLESAYYDPKTRSMRENPHKDKDPTSLSYAGDNFVRWSGEAKNVTDMQLFCWEAHQKGLDVHSTYAPSETELKYKQFQAAKASLAQDMNQSIRSKYSSSSDALPIELLTQTSEHYVEYSRTGAIVKGAATSIPKSKYEEDVFPLNHTSIWGSFWHKGQWGYACCRSFVRNSYCTGETGRQMFQDSSSLSLQQ